MKGIARHLAALSLVGALASTAGVGGAQATSGHRETEPSQLAVPTAGCLYHGVYPGGVSGEEDDITLDDVTSYEAAAGRHVAWVFFSNNWYHSRAFPSKKATWINEHGSVPYIRLMLRHSSREHKRSDGPDKTFALRRIIRGDFDKSLRAWGAGAAAYPGPLLVEYGTEINGFWFSWNATHNGEQHGAKRFQHAYRHIIDVISSRGADNVSWVFHVNDSDQPHQPWNRLERYYPGDRYIDWLATSVYGALTPQEHWNQSFARGMDSVYPRLRQLAPTKPIMVAEFGVTSGNSRVEPTTWAAHALDGLLADKWPRVRGISWWNETWENDDVKAHDSELRIQHIPGMSTVFQDRLVGHPAVLGVPETGGTATCG